MSRSHFSSNKGSSACKVRAIAGYTAASGHSNYCIIFNRECVGAMFRDFIQLFFPELCRVCSAPLARTEALICTACRASLPRIDPGPQAVEDAGLRFSGAIHFKYTLAYLKFHKAGAVQKLLHQIKYNSEPRLAFLLGTWFGHSLADAGLGGQFDLIVPVPLHRKKQRMRGYNQSERFAAGISAATGIAQAPALVERTVMNETQTHKSRLERWKNVEGIFRVRDASQIRDRRILLVDDVITTGATMEACAVAIVACDAREISAAAIALAQ
jgi:ComF family protein